MSEKQRIEIPGNEAVPVSQRSFTDTERLGFYLKHQNSPLLREDIDQGIIHKEMLQARMERLELILEREGWSLNDLYDAYTALRRKWDKK